MRTGSDLLLLLAPPLLLLDKLEATPNLPEPIKVWLDRWQAIRSDGPSEVDTVTPEVYQEALLVVEEKTAKKKVRGY